MSVDGAFLFDAGQRLLLATILGGAIGLEREIHDKPAGFRTHTLVCLGATLVMIVSATFSGPSADPGRIAAQVVSGIGFLGAGTIIRRGDITVGLTTAASLWIVSGIGLAVGHPDSRLALLAALATVLVLLTLVGFTRVETLLIRKPSVTTLRVVSVDEHGLLSRVSALAEAIGARVTGARLERREANEPFRMELRLNALAGDQASRLLQEVLAIPGVRSARLDNS